MKNYKMKFLFTAATAVFFFSAFAQGSHEFSVQQAVDYGVKNSPQVKNALTDIQIQQQVNREITAAALPHLNASVNVNYNPNIAVQSMPNFIAMGTYGVLVQEGVKDGNGNPIAMPGDFGYIQAQFGSKYIANGGIDFSQILFDGQVFIGLQARDASIKVAQMQAEVTSEQIKANIQKIYYQLVVGKKQLSTISANIDRLSKLLHDTEIIYQNGFAEKLDIDKVNVQLNNLLAERLRVQNQIDAGYAGLKFLMSMPQKDDLILTDTVNEDVLKSNILDQEYNYTDRKEYQLAQSTHDLLKYNVRRYQLSALPTAVLFANYGKNAQRNKFDFFGDGPWFTSSMIGLKITMPLFDGFARRSKLEQAKLNLTKVENNMEMLRHSIDNDVEQSRLKFITALTTVDMQKRNMELAEKVYNVTKLKYEQGLGSNQEIYNAHTELRMAQNNYYSSFYDAIQARIDFMKAIGKL